MRWVWRSGWMPVAGVVILGLTVFSYGFANLAVGFGQIRLPAVHAILGVSLLWVGVQDIAGVRRFFSYWAARGWLLLALVATAHLFADVPEHGLVAIRDASFVFEAAFLVLGYLWWRRLSGRNGTSRLLRWMALIAGLNFLYALLFPFKVQVQNLSPTSGIFRAGIPIFGSFINSAPMLAVGGILATLVALYAADDRTRLAGLAFGIAQLGWSFVHQVRSIYLGLLAVVLVFLVLRRWKAAASVAVVSMLGLALLLLLASTALVGLEGRIGPVTYDFYVGHLTTIFPEELLEDLQDPSLTEPTEEAAGESQGGHLMAPMAFRGRLRGEGTAESTEQLPMASVGVAGKESSTLVGSEGQALAPTATATVVPSGEEDPELEGAAKSTQWRLRQWSNLIADWSRSPRSLLIGDGFGHVLTDSTVRGEIPVRQPHNTNLTVLARLGLLGLIPWIGLHLWIGLSILRLTFLAGEDWRAMVIGQGALTLFVVGHTLTSFQPWLEFTYGSVPFFTFTGLALAMWDERRQRGTMQEGREPRPHSERGDAADAGSRVES